MFLTWLTNMLSANIYDRYVLNLATSTHTVAAYSCKFKSERLILCLSGSVVGISKRMELGYLFLEVILCVCLLSL